MYLSDNPANPHKYQLTPLLANRSPLFTLHSSRSTLTIPPHGYRVVWCDGREPIDQLHASFKLENADSAFVSIQAADGSWADSLRYQAQGRWQTFGRYPDGADQVALMDRTTIKQPNHINTHTVLTAITPPGPPSDIRSIRTATSSQIADIQYYNLNGQRLSRSTDARIIIRRIIYTDGTTESKKMSNSATNRQ